MSMSELDRRCVDAAIAVPDHDELGPDYSAIVRAVLAEAGVAELVEARDNRDTLRRAVLQWMNDQGAQGRLRTNDQAPMWLDYIKSEEAYSSALAKIGANQ